MFLEMWIEGTNNTVDKIKIIITKEKTRNLKSDNLIITLNLTFIYFHTWNYFNINTYYEFKYKLID